MQLQNSIRLIATNLNSKLVMQSADVTMRLARPTGNNDNKQVKSEKIHDTLMESFFVGKSYLAWKIVFFIKRWKI
jgi:hypothetical protein